MPSSQAAATERRSNERTVSPDRVTHEPPKLKTTLKTPPKQATNPLQFVKVGPCSLYRTAQEQLQKVQEVKKVKQEIRDDPEDWQSNLDNWKSSRRKRQEHIIERVVEVKKLELEEHDRQRRRSKTFSEMMEERGNRGRKLSISLAMYNEEDANDLSDLGIGTSSGKSSVSGDTHDDTQSVLSDRDSEIDKNHSDVDNAGHENGNGTNNSSATNAKCPAVKTAPSVFKKEVTNNGFHKSGHKINNRNNQQEYDSATTATASSPEPEEYEGTIRGFASRVPPTVPRRPPAVMAGVPPAESKSNGSAVSPTVKVDILKRREIFEKSSSRESLECKNNNNNNNNRLDFGSNKSIKERLSFLERPKIEEERPAPRHAIESTVRERFARDLQVCERGEMKTRDLLAEELEGVKPLKERLSILEKFTDQGFPSFGPSVQLNGELNAKTVKERLISLDVNHCKEAEKRSTNCFHEQANMRIENSTPSERSSSPDSEYRAPRATFHQSLDSLDADASSGPDTFERVQSLEELDYHQARRYPASSSSAEVLNDTDREDSGIHTADASCSVSQADEPIEEEISSAVNIVAEKQSQQQQMLQQNVIVEEKTEFRGTIETTLVESSFNLIDLERIDEDVEVTSEWESCPAVLTESGTADISSSSSTCTSGEPLLLSANIIGTEPRSTNPEVAWPSFPSSSERPVVYQSPRVPPRRSAPDPPPKPSFLPLLETTTQISPSSEEAAKSSPLPSPRSKIPTPLPRKSVPASPSPSASPKRRQASEIPVLVKSSPSSPSPPTSPRSALASPDARRRTVVEVCEKVVVSRGQARVTPFITVERYADEASGSTEVRVDEQLTTAYKKS